MKHHSYRNSQVAENQWCDTWGNGSWKLLGEQAQTPQVTALLMAPPAASQHEPMSVVAMACRSGKYLGSFWEVLEVSNRS